MQKQVVDLVRNYVKKLSDQDRAFLQLRLRDRMCGDVSEVVSLLQKNPGMDHWLRSSNGANELYDMVDIVGQYIECVPASSS